MKVKPQIKVGFCVAYDWYMLKDSLPLVYEYSDVICLSLDKDRTSWVGNIFEFDEVDFYSFIKEIDKQSKIIIYEDDFHLKDLSPMENEVRQRNLMAQKMNNGGWHIQLDADEYFVNFEGFTKYLKNFKPKRNVNISCPWLTLYKKTSSGYLAVNINDVEQVEFISIATNAPNYEHGRRNSYFNIYTPFILLHQSWARTEEEVWTKLSNWGHRLDMDIKETYQLWLDLNESNYQNYKDFNPIQPKVWPSLVNLQLGSSGLKGLDISQFENLFKQPKAKSWLNKKNSIWYSRFNKLITIIKSKFKK